MGVQVGEVGGHRYSVGAHGTGLPGVRLRQAWGQRAEREVEAAAPASRRSRSAKSSMSRKPALSGQMTAQTQQPSASPT